MFTHIPHPLASGKQFLTHILHKKVIYVLYKVNFWSKFVWSSAESWRYGARDCHFTRLKILLCLVKSSKSPMSYSRISTGIANVLIEKKHRKTLISSNHQPFFDPQWCLFVKVILHLVRYMNISKLNTKRRRLFAWLVIAPFLCKLYT